MEMRVVRADWHKDNTTIRHIRFLVFVEEMSVPLELEIDGRDPRCAHVLAFDTQGEAIGTGRIDDHGKIGRMAILSEARRQGVGSTILQELITVATERGHQEVVLNAQQSAIAFYEKQGFTTIGDPFTEAGLPHHAMTRPLG